MSGRIMVPGACNDNVPVFKARTTRTRSLPAVSVALLVAAAGSVAMIWVLSQIILAR